MIGEVVVEKKLILSFVGSVTVPNRVSCFPAFKAELIWGQKIYSGFHLLESLLHFSWWVSS
jgi:hypothetical protein